MADNEISILVKAEVSKALSELKKVEQAPKTIAQQAEKYLGQLGNNIKGFFTGLGAAIIAGGAAKAIQDLTKKGVEFLDLQDDFQTLFAGMAGSANRMRDGLVRDLGLSTDEVTRMLSQVGILTQSMGFNTEKSLDMASKIVKLSTAIERFSPTGVTAAQATDALTAAINGQDRQLRLLGITISDQEKLKEAERLGIRGTITEWTKLETATVNLNLAYAKSGTAIEGLDAKNRSLADTLKIAANGFDDLKTGVGIELATTLSQILPNLDDIGTSINDIRRVARPVIDVLLALGQTMILAFTIPGSIIVATVKSIVTLAKSTANLTQELINGNFKNAAVEAETLAKQTAESVRNIATAPLDVLRSTGASYINAYKSITGQVKIEEAKDDKIKLARNDARIAGNAVTTNTILKSETDLAEKQRKLEENAAKRQEELRKEREQREKEIALALIDNAKQITDSIFAYDQTVRDAKLAADIAAIDRRNQYSEEIAAMAKARDEARDAETLADLEAQLAAETDATKKAAIQKQIDKFKADAAYDAQVEELRIKEAARNAEIAKQERKLRYDAAVQDKAAKRAMAVINGAVAITTALAQLGPIFGAIAAVGIGVSTGFQIAAIDATPLPALATGGLVRGPQAIIAGERGVEAVLPNDLTELLLNAAGQGRTGGTVNIGQVVANDPQQFAAALDRHLKTRGNWITV